MAAPVCYIVNKDIDGYIASKWGWKPDKKDKGMNPVKIASLRGLYDQQAQEQGKELLLSDNPTQEELDAAFDKLVKFRSKLKAIHEARVSSGIKHVDRAWDALRHSL